MAEEIEKRLPSTSEIEIGINEEKGCLTVSEYKPDYQSAFFIKNGNIQYDNVDLDIIRKECDKRKWNYVL